MGHGANVITNSSFVLIFVLICGHFVINSGMTESTSVSLKTEKKGVETEIGKYTSADIVLHA